MALQAPDKSPTQACYNSGFQVRGLDEGGPIWHQNAYTDLIYELSNTDLSQVRNASTPNIAPYGVGGGLDVIWSMDNTIGDDAVYELSVADFSVIRSEVGPGTPTGGTIGPAGVGGKANVIYATNMTDREVFELATSDFAIIRSAASPGVGPFDIGGTTTHIWHCDGSSGPFNPAVHGMYELSVVDFSTVQFSAVARYFGAGGSNTRVWFSLWGNISGQSVGERSPVDLSVVAQAPAPSVGNSGIGGP